MYEGPSIALVTSHELDTGIAYAQARYPNIVIDREKLHRIMDEILEKFLRNGRSNYLNILRDALEKYHLQYKPVAREAYKSAIAKIMGARKSKHTAAKRTAERKKETKRMIYDIEHEIPIIISDIGHLLQAEVEAELALYNMGDDFIPMR